MKIDLLKKIITDNRRLISRRVYRAGYYISSLLKVAKYHNAKRLLIITYNEEQTIEVINNIVEVISLWKWFQGMIVKHS